MVVLGGALQEQVDSLPVSGVERKVRRVVKQGQSDGSRLFRDPPEGFNGDLHDGMPETRHRLTHETAHDLHVARPLERVLVGPQGGNLNAHGR